MKKIWNKIKDFFTKISEQLKKAVSDEKSAKTFEYIFIFSLLTLAGGAATIYVACTNQDKIMWATLVMAVGSIVNILLFLGNNKVTRYAAIGLFAFEMASCLLFFVLLGYPTGFSVLWITMVPTFAVLLFGLRYGALYSILMFLLVCFLFYTPYGKSLLQFQYSEDFLLRFPFLFLGILFLAMFFEIVRHYTFLKLLNTKNEYEYLSTHDNLTDVYNRHGFYEELEKIFKEEKLNIGFIMIDFDNFKGINDTYGHRFGDVALKEISMIMKDLVKDEGIICRWGGEEFVIITKDANNVEKFAIKLLEVVNGHDYVLDDEVIHITVSAGVIRIKNKRNVIYDKVLKQADKNLYQAKNNGKNQLVITDYVE